MQGHSQARRVGGIDAHVPRVHAEVVRVKDADRAQLFFQRFAEEDFYLHWRLRQHGVRGRRRANQQRVGGRRRDHPNAIKKNEDNDPIFFHYQLKKAVFPIRGGYAY